jgi:hypothetical protein
MNKNIFKYFHNENMVFRILAFHIFLQTQNGTCLLLITNKTLHANLTMYLT